MVRASAPAGNHRVPTDHTMYARPRGVQLLASSGVSFTAVRACAVCIYPSPLWFADCYRRPADMVALAGGPALDWHASRGDLRQATAENVRRIGYADFL